MKLRALVVASAVIGTLSATSGASAQSLTLRIENGLVTLDANNVTVDEILARWTAATGLNVVSKNGAGSDVPVTLQLSGVSEREALQTVLRALSGYIMGERRNPQTGVVTIDRLLILPESAPQSPTAATASASRLARTSATQLPRNVIQSPEIAPAEEPFNEPVFNNELGSLVEIAPQTGGAGNGTAAGGIAPGGIVQGGLVDGNGNMLADTAPAAPTAVPTAPAGAARPGTIVAPVAPVGNLRTTPRLNPSGDQ